MPESIAILGTGLCCPDEELLAPWGFKNNPIDRDVLPAAIRRRSSLATRIAVTAASYACRDAGVDPMELTSVFASIGGEAQIIDRLCRALPDTDTQISPTQFHNSVHNTTSAYWSIVSQCTHATTAIASAFDTFAMGLLEVWSQAQSNEHPILLVCYDEEWPEFFYPPFGQIPLASALILSADLDAKNRRASLSVPTRGNQDTRMDETLESLVNRAQAASAIPLLKAVQSGPACGEVPLSVGDQIWVTQLSA